FELVQNFKNQHFYERIFPVVLDEVNIADPSERVKLIKYWENETENLSNEIKQLKDLSNIQGLTDDLNLNAEIRDNIARLTDILKDTNTLSLDKLIGSNFEPLYKAIQKKIKSDSALEATGTNGASVTNKDELESERKKKNNIKIAKRLVIAIALLVLVVMGFRAIWDNPPVDEEKEQLDSLDLFDGRKDALKVLDEKIEDTLKINEISLEETTPSSNIKYNVDLVVPSQMAQADVFVDGKPAEIVERGLISITVQIRKKETSHHFEIRSNGDRCFTDKLVSNDNIKLTLCN
ncbi:MAG: hypothetical protein HKN31_06275, partial [Pricia sp.]|nr:hypothetical protein [Pricia sp.]